MASNRGAGMDADWAEHVRTYNGFLWVLKAATAITAIVLLALYFFLAR